MKKRGFTLIELMIVIALIATLMGIVFRLSSSSADESARIKTVVRLSMLENCLAGYYAANGGYPPVRLHGSRDIYFEVGDDGTRKDDRNENIWGWYDELRADHGIGKSREELTAWQQVQAACFSQPVACSFPFNKSNADSVRKYSDELKRRATGGEFTKYGPGSNPQYDLFAVGFDALNSNPGRFSGHEGETSWDEIKIFKFGLMSFLLPRLQMMMGGDESLYNDFAQWTGNNSLPSDPLTGNAFNSWSDIVQMNEDIREENEANNKSKSSSKQNNTFRQRQTLASIPSQAACARWLPNLRLMCTCSSSPETEDQDTGYLFYGVQIAEIGDPMFMLSDDKDSDPPHVEVYTPPGNNNAARDCYLLDSVTVQDGWGEEFYYYSPTPHQKYQLWSSGKNKRTFPPWISRSELAEKQGAVKCVASWTSDDIIGLSN